MSTVEPSASSGVARGNGEQANAWAGSATTLRLVSSFGRPGPVTGEDLGERPRRTGGRSTELIPLGVSQPE
jgi:hypothetical protein